MSLVIPRHVLKEAASVMETAGSMGREATGHLVAGLDHVARRFVAPDQVGGEWPRAWVEVTDRGKLALAAHLGANERYVARLHSHPGAERHSPTDDLNPALTFTGALSIVVPFWGLALRRGLSACLVYRFDGRHWLEISSGEDYPFVVDA